MKFYARLSPGVQDDLAAPLTLACHLPRAAAGGVAIKLWELATWVGVDGRLVEEGGGDDLLLELHGALAPDPALRALNQVRFTVERTVVPPSPAGVRLDHLRLCVSGGDAVYDVPVPSTRDELGGQNFELAITIEHGGAEVFRSRAPVFVRPRLVNPRAAHVPLIAGLAGDTEDREADAVELIGRHATIGCATADPRPRLHVLGGFAIGPQGRLAPLDGGPALARLRAGRPLFAYVTRARPALAGTVGPSAIPIALCHPIAEDGTLEVAEHPPAQPYLIAPAIAEAP